jgi:hypothetical protein
MPFGGASVGSLTDRPPGHPPIPRPEPRKGERTQNVLRFRPDPSQPHFGPCSGTFGFNRNFAPGGCPRELSLSTMCCGWVFAPGHEHHPVGANATPWGQASRNYQPYRGRTWSFSTFHQPLHQICSDFDGTLRDLILRPTLAPLVFVEILPGGLPQGSVPKCDVLWLGLGPWGPGSPPRA